MKRSLGLLMGVLAVAAGCQKTESKTEIILEISTNIPVPAGMNSLSLKIGPQANPLALNKTYPLGTGAGQIMLPRRMTLVPTDTNTVLSVLVEGQLGGKTVVSRQVITGFAKGESKLLSVELLQKCVGQVCQNGQTCTPAAFCADPRVDPANLPPFDPGQNPKTPGLDPDGGASVDATADQTSGDGKRDGLPGKDGASVDGPRGGLSDGQFALDTIPNAPETGLIADGPIPSEDGPSNAVDGPGGVVIPVTDASTAVDAPQKLDGPGGVKLDVGMAIDTPVAPPDVPPASRTKGVACNLTSECESGLSCVDGVCCESKCEGTCMACNVPGKQGTCAAIPLNDPSNGECPDDGVATCGRNGRCNGAGGCMLYPMGVSCSAETCPEGTSSHTRAGLCDGKGVCGLGQAQNCAPFLCNATTKSCNLTCTGDSDCVAPNKCLNGSCGKKSNGQPCSAPGDCQSDVCAQGICCSASCTDLCKSCAVDGSLGTCTFVPAGKPDFQARCQDQGQATCGTNGLCDGIGACQKYPDSLPCGARCEPTTATFTTSTCSAGSCTPGTPQACSPYNCDNTGCKKSCTVLTDCAPGFVCGAGGLCVRPPEDCMNGIDDDGDGQVDCADPDCTAGFTCVPSVPAGFTGPVELAEGATQADLPNCDGAYPTESYTGWGTPQCSVTCKACGCSAPAGVTCTNPTAGYTTSLSEDRLVCTRQTAPTKPGICVAIPTSGTYNTLVTGAGIASGGACTKIGGDASLSPVGWTAGRVCGSSASGGGGCAANSMCWPKPQAPYQPQACVVGSGILSCPSSGYTDKHEYFDTQEISDTRTCTNTCSCGDPSGVSCHSSVTVYPALGGRGACDSLLAKTMKNPSCTSFSGIGYWDVALGSPPFSGGSCTPTGSATPSGGCTPLGQQTTVCCTP